MPICNPIPHPEMLVEVRNTQQKQFVADIMQNHSKMTNSNLVLGENDSQAKGVVVDKLCDKSYMFSCCALCLS